MMSCIKFGGAIMCGNYPVHEGMDSRGKLWRWEFHPYCGPFFVRKDGEPMAVQPSSKSKAWEAFNNKQT
jgi:hypothetical protein